MWRRNEISFALVEDFSQGEVAGLRILTPAGELLIMGCPSDIGRTLHVAGVHMHGLAANEVSVANLYVIAQRFMEVFSYDGLILEGALRTTGRRKGAIPRPIRFTWHREPPLER